MQWIFRESEGDRRKMEVKNICRKCGELNKVNSDTLLRKEVTTVDGEYLKVIYFVCSRCKTKNIVQVDDFETRNKFAELKKLIIKVSNKQLKHETVSPKDVKKKDKLIREINSKRKLLEEKFSGKKLFEEDGKIFVEQLTMCMDGDIIDSNL